MGISQPGPGRLEQRLKGKDGVGQHKGRGVGESWPEVEGVAKPWRKS